MPVSDNIFLRRITMNETATKPAPTILPSIEYEDEATELIKERNVQSDVATAVKWLSDYFPGTTQAYLSVVEGADEDSEPHLVLFVDYPDMTSDAFISASKKFIDRQMNDTPNLRLAILPGRK